MAQLFEVIVSPYGESLPVQRAYGSITTSSGRLDMLRAAIEGFIETESHGDDEKDRAEGKAAVKSVLDSCQKLGARRNDIAHGLVIEYAHLTYVVGSDVLGFEGVRPGYCLVPPEYTAKKRDMRSKPKYVYNSDIVEGFATAFHDTAGRVTSFRGGLWKTYRAGRVQYAPTNPGP